MSAFGKTLAVIFGLLLLLGGGGCSTFFLVSLGVQERNTYMIFILAGYALAALGLGLLLRAFQIDRKGKTPDRE